MSIHMEQSEKSAPYSWRTVYETVQQLEEVSGDGMDSRMY